MSEFILLPPLAPPPQPAPPPHAVPLGAHVYVSTQGDAWDMIAIRVYGARRGNEHLMYRLLEENYPLRNLSIFPAGVAVVVPAIDVQTENPACAVEVGHCVAMSEHVETRQGQVVGVAVVVFTREPAHTQVQQRRVPMTAHQAMSLLNFVKHRLHGGRLTLEPLHAEQEKLIITPP